MDSVLLGDMPHQNDICLQRLGVCLLSKAGRGSCRQQPCAGSSSHAVSLIARGSIVSDQGLLHTAGHGWPPALPFLYSLTE